MNGPVTIVGAGVAGLTIAWTLHQAGYEVTLWDKAPEPGPHHCSWWAGGMLAPYCEAESAEPEVTLWGRVAAEWWEAAVGGVSRRGTLVVTLNRDRSELARFARRTDGFQTLDGAQIDALEPDLSGRVQQGLFFAEEAHLNPRDALRTLRQKLQTGGARFATGEVDPQALQGRVVDARGFAARDVLPGLRGVKGEMLVLFCPDVALTRPIRMLHPRMPVYIVPRGDGIYMLGATQIEAAAGKRATARSVVELLNAAYALNPAFGEAEIVEIGVDSRPAFSNNLPQVVREGDVIRANGLFRHGFLLSPWLAQEVLRMLQSEEVRHAS